MMENMVDNYGYKGQIQGFNGYLDFYLNKYQQTVITYSSLLDNYETDRFNPSSRLRSAYNFVELTSMIPIWDSQYYQSHYKTDGQLTSNMTEYRFGVTVTNDPNGEITNYELFTDSSKSINPSEYSLINYRREAPLGTTYSFN